MEEDDNLDSADILSTDEYGIPEYRELIVNELNSSNQQDHGGPRLMIKKIVNENFKSYAGIQELGPFHKNFNAIIGPNGSGKSNVIDSMLFVFGYRATKIRSKKISVLIHNSEGRQNIESCTVSVHFQKIKDEGPGDKEFKVIEGSQFIVSRTAFKDSSSFYKLNNRKVHYREVEAFLKASGVDLVHNRFLILQGEVEQIAMMKPKSQNKNEDGLLEFLEDIIGSNRFKDPIDTLAKRIEFLAELKTEKYNRVKAVEIEKNELEKDKNEAVEFLTLQNDIIKNTNLIAHEKMFIAMEKCNEISEKKNDILTVIKELDDRNEEILKEKKEKAKEYKEAIKNYNNLTKEYDRCKDEFSRFEDEDVRCREDMKHSIVKAKKLESSLQQEEKKHKEFLMIPDKQEKDLEDLKKRLAKLEKEKKVEQDRFNEVMSNFQDETKDLQTEKTKKEAELLEFQKDVNEAKHKFQVLQMEVDLFNSNLLKDNNKLADIQRNIERVKNTLKEKRLVHEDLKSKVPETSGILDKCKKDLESLNEAQQVKQEEVKQLRMKVEVARSNFQANQNQGKVLEFLMNLKKNGELTGIYGRLGDLGAIDEKYDVAISTACGYLDHIIVDNMDTAQKCIQVLKDGNVGRASFIGLDHMAKWKEFCNKKINTPENVPRLFDLIKVNNKDIVPAFYFSLRDTLVSKDIQEATRIAYGPTRFRVVTLGGQLIDLSGTMSGGGTKVTKGKMGSRIVEESDETMVLKMEKELDKGSREVEGFRENRMKLQENITNLQKTYREYNNAFQKVNNEINSLEEQCENYKTQEKELLSVVKKTPVKDKKILAQEQKVEQLKSAYEKIQKVASDMEDEIHELHKQIMEVGGKELKSIETRMTLLETQIDQINNTINKITVAIETAHRNSKKCEARVVTLKNEIKENNDKMNQLEIQIKKIETEAHDLLELLNKNEENIMIHNQEMAKVTEILSKYDDEELEIKTQKVKVKHQLDKMEEEEKEMREHLDSIKESIANLHLNEIWGKEPETLEKFQTMEELGEIDSKDLNMKNNVTQEMLSKMKPNMAAIEEFEKKNEIYLRRVDEMTRVSKLKDLQRQHFENFRKRRLDEFMAGFVLVTNKLKEMYQMITLGGDAELELVDSLDPFSEGIVFSVRPPSKSWKNISNLSGGEKTLSSLALVFALHHYKPTPFYVMDEIDAALDFRNVSIVANYIRERTENAQFIVISLRNNMFEQCDRLIGIYKVRNCTSSMMVKPHEVAKQVEGLENWKHII